MCTKGMHLQIIVHISMKYSMKSVSIALLFRFIDIETELKHIDSPPLIKVATESYKISMKSLQNQIKIYKITMTN
jgi:hypothetical protein